MNSSPTLMTSVSIMVVILLSLTALNAAPLRVLFNNLPATYAQSSQSIASQPETHQNQRSVILEGTVISSQDPLPGHEEQQMATILPFRQDGTIYSGILTYTATKPVEVAVLTMQTFNETEQEILNGTDNGEFNTVIASQLDSQTSLSVAYIQPQSSISPVASASIPFAGNAVWLHTTDGTPFAATFAVNALIFPSEIRNIISDSAETSVDAGTIEEDEGAIATEDVDTDTENTTASETEEVTEEGEASTTEQGTGETEEDVTTSAATNEEVIVRIPQGASELTEDAYTPNPVEINTGETVVWINDDTAPHTATSGTSGSGATGMFGGTEDSPEIIEPGGDTQSFTFDEPGEFDYYCTLHPNMVGTVIVTDE